MDDRRSNKKIKKEHISWVFVLFFLSLLGFFVYIIIEHGEIIVLPPFKLGSASQEYSDYWNWMIYQVHGKNQYYIDITYFVGVFSFFIGLIYLFANVKDGGFTRYYSNKSHIREDVILFVVFIALKIFLWSLDPYRLYMVLVTPIFLNFYVVKYVLYSKKYDN